MQAEAGSQGSDLKVQRWSKDQIWSKGLPVEQGDPRMWIQL